MNKLKTIIDLVNQGDKAKLWKYLNKGIYSKKDKIDVVKSKGGQSGGEGGGNSGVNIRYIKGAGNVAMADWAIQVKIYQEADSTGGSAWPESVSISGGYFYGFFHTSRNLKLLALAIDLDMPFTSISNGVPGSHNSLREYLHLMDVDDTAIEEMITKIEITKEEFYDLTNHHGVI